MSEEKYPFLNGMQFIYIDGKFYFIVQREVREQSLKATELLDGWLEAYNTTSQQGARRVDE